jgi:dCTP deaminase
MTVLSAQTIRKIRPVEPFHERSVVCGMSFGLSSCGYDIRIAETIVLRPGEFALASSIEKFDIPDDVCAELKDKSTLVRRGLAVQNTILEPGWRGYLTLELTNHANPTRRWWHFWRWREWYRKDPLRPEGTIVLLAGMPIAQAVFHPLDEPTDQPYESGKYQDQKRGPQAALYEDESMVFSGGRDHG